MTIHMKADKYPLTQINGQPSDYQGSPLEAKAKLRADARINRDRILEVAHEALAADSQASLHSIAKAAGVGQGTLYRHFATREALILAVYRKQIDALVTLAPKLLSEHPAADAFHLWCERFTEYGRVKHGIAGVLRAAMSDQDFRETYWPMVDAARQLLAACEHNYDIAPGADPEDILQFLGLLMQLPGTSEGTARARRLLALLFRGMKAQHE